MAVITLTATNLGSELVAGIPLQVKLSTNVPSTIFYTLDGTMPSVLSSVYIEPILMPTDQNAVSLRALAISGGDNTRINIIYSSNFTDQAYYRRLDACGIGIAVDAYDVENVLLDGYTTNPNNVVNVPIRYSDYELKDLEIQYSESGENGVGPGTLLQMGPIIQHDPTISFDRSSPNNNNVYFNPRSLYIVIDSRDGYEGQSVRVINNAYSDNRDMVNYYSGRDLYRSRPYLAGGLVRTMYAKKADGTGIACSYYWNSNEGRWIKSIRTYDPAKVPVLSNTTALRGPPFVFRWIRNKGNKLG